MKSQERTLLLVEEGLCKDVLLAYPQIEGIGKDLVRITSSVKNRGLGFFTLDLPNLDSLLLKGLEKGRLVLEGPCSHARSKRIRVPRLFSGLWLRVFDKSGVLLEDVDVTAIAFLRQLCCIGKRIEVPCAPHRLKAIKDEYHGIESECRHPTLRWGEDVLDPDNRGYTVSFHDGTASDCPLVDRCESREPDGVEIRRLLSNLEHVCSRIAAAFGTPCVEALSQGEGPDQGTILGLRHGPGAVSDNRRGNDKYAFPNWPEKLQHFFPFDRFGVLNLNHYFERTYPSPHEPPSKLMQVPKTAKAPRLIASEPTCYQWCQQLLARFITDKLDKIFKGDFVTIRDQNPSRRMVVAASLDRSLATIDLSSASDRLSCWTVERVFRGNKILLELLHAVRTRWTVDHVVRGEQDFLLLKKFATQGSALTFPIQSVVFLCCALAVLPRERSLEDYRRKWGKSVRVFGDDIIVPRDRYADITRLLHYLGLKVNMDKSFHEGHFRESCGMDSYKGYDVTPSRPKSVISDTPTSWSALIDYTNNLFLKGYWHAAYALESTLPARFRKDLPVVGPGCGIQGRASFCGRDISHLRRRENVHLHRDEVRIRVIQTRTLRKPSTGYTALFRFLNQRLDGTSEIISLERPSRPRLGSEFAVESKSREGFRWVPVEELVVPCSPP
jgi:hypothetical protein